jgi:GDP-mannose transporter
MEFRPEFFFYLLANLDSLLIRFSLAVVRKYILIPILFSGAIFSNSKMLEYANVETFLVFRFSTPILVACVDFALMGKALPQAQTWASFMFIVGGAVLYAETDDGFSIHTVRVFFLCLHCFSFFCLCFTIMLRSSLTYL